MRHKAPLYAVKLAAIYGALRHIAPGVSKAKLLMQVLYVITEKIYDGLRSMCSKTAYLVNISDFVSIQLRDFSHTG